MRSNERNQHETSTTSAGARRDRTRVRTVAAALVAILGLELAIVGWVTLRHAHGQVRTARSALGDVAGAVGQPSNASNTAIVDAVRRQARLIAVQQQLIRRINDDAASPLDLARFRAARPAQRYELTVDRPSACSNAECPSIAAAIYHLPLTITCASGVCEASSPQWTGPVPITFRKTGGTWAAHGSIEDTGASFRCQQRKHNTFFAMTLSVNRVVRVGSAWTADSFAGTYAVNASRESADCPDQFITWRLAARRSPV